LCLGLLALSTARVPPAGAAAAPGDCSSIGGAGSRLTLRALDCLASTANLRLRHAPPRTHRPAGAHSAARRIEPMASDAAVRGPADDLAQDYGKADGSGGTLQQRGSARQALLASTRLQFEDKPQWQRRAEAVARQGLALFPVRRDMMDGGDLMFGITKKGMVGVFLTPKALEVN
jgi:hypothetical protein